eukprot:g653.t1
MESVANVGPLEKATSNVSTNRSSQIDSSKSALGRRWRTLKSSLLHMSSKNYSGQSGASLAASIWDAVKELCSFQSNLGDASGDSEAQREAFLREIRDVREKIMPRIISKIAALVSYAFVVDKEAEDDDGSGDSETKQQDVVGRDTAFLLSRSCLRVCRSALWTEIPNVRTIMPVMPLAKILYDLSKIERLDEFFRTSGVLEEILDLVSVNASSVATPETVDSHEGDRAGAVVVVSWPLPFELMVYCAAVLKNVSQTSNSQLWLGRRGGAVGVLTDLLRFRTFDRRSEADAELKRQRRLDLPASAEGGWTRVVTIKQAAQVLLQVTVALRNLTLARKHFKQFVSHGSVEYICALARDETFREHADLMYNVSRILSKLSLDQNCRKDIKVRGNDNIGAMMRLLELHPHHCGLIIRVSFVLGNLTASNNTNRRLLMSVRSASRRAAEIFGDLMCRYVRTYKSVVVKGNDAMSASTATDVADIDEVLVKFVRLIANVAIDPDAGEELAASSVASSLIDLLSFIALRPEHEEIDDDDAASREHFKGSAAESSKLERSDDRSNDNHGDELRVFVVSALTNLSFYGRSERSKIHQSRLRISKQLVPLLVTSRDPDLISEALRALGNFTRDPDVRDLVAEMRGTEAAIVLLDHQDPGIVMSACGVILNFAADPNPSRTAAFDEFDAVGKLFAIISDAIFSNIDIAVVACKALCNFALNESRIGRSGRTQGSRRFFSNTQCVGLRALLSNISEHVTPSDDEEAKHLDRANVPELEEVAQNLLREISPDGTNDEESNFFMTSK